jgi:excisionase family DNA binding protein
LTTTREKPRKEARAAALGAAGKKSPPQPPEQDSVWLTTEEMAGRLHVCPPTLLKWGRTGKLPFCQLDRKALWHRESVDQALLRLARANGNGNGGAR